VAGISVVPRWVLVGVALGALASVGVALVFYLGSRLSPPREQATPDSSRGSTRRREEIRAYLTAIDERFREDHAVGGVSVPFYLPARDVAVTFDAHDYFRLEGEGVHAVLCEHEMPGRGLGRRLPFDVTEPEWGPDPRRSRTPESVEAAFSELDLPTDADADEVKRAYRERVKQAHPDRGGDEEAFQRVQAAYATASDHADDETTRPDPGDRREASSGFGR
jgi:DnaJ-domain-containing protein 1